MSRHLEDSAGLTVVVVLVPKASPRQLPKRKQDAQLVVKLQEVIKSSEEELRLSLTFSLEPHHICLQGQVLTD